jgi:hypothetical protein
MPHKVFWLEPANTYKHELRRYASGSQCVARPHGMSIHDARVELGVVEAEEYPTSYCLRDSEDTADDWKTGTITRTDPRWPAQCVCGYVFADADTLQVNYEKLYEVRGGVRDGERHTLRDAPIGAMWDADWFRGCAGGEPWTGPDGLCLVVKTPGGDWMVDGEASNCTRTQYGPKVVDGTEYQKAWLGRTHYCWIRHGDPRTGNVHVDKDGDTCAAGAGSILIGGYHGFLHNGYLTDC